MTAAFVPRNEGLTLPTATDQRTALVAALHHYLTVAEDETAKARAARNREVVAAYDDGVPVSQLADIMGMSVRGAYKVLDEGKRP